jgi:hypothetical protein
MAALARLSPAPTALPRRAGIEPGGGANAGFADQSFNTMFASARDQIARSLLK